MGITKDLLDNYGEQLDYCETVYMEEWNSIISKKFPDENGKVKSADRREAQKEAIDKTFISALIKYPDVEEEVVWSIISTVHKLNVAHLEDLDLDRIQRIMAYDRCISAHQSWNKASGHSFERYIAKISTAEMKTHEIRFALKSDALKMIKNGKMYNHPDDLKLIEEWNDNFDLYAIQTIHEEAHIFGCIQVKTSIRDRVGRDDQFSKNAMNNHFWVAEAVLNGDFFKLPKYNAMVNGGSITYPENNWHGVYVMSGIESNGRIYRDDGFELMAKHAIAAARVFGVSRSTLTREWIAE